MVRRLPKLSFMLSKVLMFPFLGSDSSPDEDNHTNAPANSVHSYSRAPQQDTEDADDDALEEDRIEELNEVSVDDMEPHYRRS